MLSSSLPQSLYLLVPLYQIASAQSSGYAYSLQDSYEGASFFDGFSFFTGADPTNGYVTYVDEAIAQQNGLISTNSSTIYIGVDYTSLLNPSGAGRQSVRLESTTTYTDGLFIGDFAHMPGGICGVWPAWWTYGADWPNSGEIDIIENANAATTNLMSLHTDTECTIAGADETGLLITNDCNQYSALEDGTGCGVANENKNSYGSGFNANGGGVYAMEWTNSSIRGWFFPRGSIPADITAGNPTPSTWSTPFSNFQGSCDIPAHFFNHRMVFDTTFCGDWAGAVFANDPMCSSLANSCTDYVALNPAAFADAYWAINSVKVYRQAAGFGPAGPAGAASAVTQSTSNVVQSSSSSIIQLSSSNLLMSASLGVVQSTSLSIFQSTSSSVVQSTSSGVVQSTSLGVVQSTSLGVVQSTSLGVVQSTSSGIVKSTSLSATQSNSATIVQPPTFSSVLPINPSTTQQPSSSSGRSVATVSTIPTTPFSASSTALSSVLPVLSTRPLHTTPVPAGETSISPLGVTAPPTSSPMAISQIPATANVSALTTNTVASTVKLSSTTSSTWTSTHASMPVSQTTPSVAFTTVFTTYFTTVGSSLPAPSPVGVPVPQTTQPTVLTTVFTTYFTTVSSSLPVPGSAVSVLYITPATAFTTVLTTYYTTLNFGPPAPTSSASLADITTTTTLPPSVLSTYTIGSATCDVRVTQIGDGQIQAPQTVCSVGTTTALTALPLITASTFLTTWAKVGIDARNEATPYAFEGAYTSTPTTSADNWWSRRPQRRAYNERRSSQPVDEISDHDISRPPGSGKERNKGYATATVHEMSNSDAGKHDERLEPTPDAVTDDRNIIARHRSTAKRRGRGSGVVRNR